MLIGHLDADCFYVSAERIRRPALLHVPVGVLGNQGACVIAKSYEMKAAGVKTGQPIWEAVKLCPRGIFIKRDFRWYEVVSRQMLDIVRRYSPKVEYYSIDEFFFEAEGVDPTAIQQEILKSVGVPVTIGISLSRTLAKLTSDRGKPFGCSVLTAPGEIADYLETMPIDEVTGIARRSAAKLATYGIRTCGDFRRADPKLINRLLTKVGEGLYWELHGQQIMKINTHRPMHKAVGRGGSIGAATSDWPLVTAWVVRNIERLVEVLHWHQYVASQLTLSLGYQRGGNTHTTSLPEASGAWEILLPAALHLLSLCPRGVVTHVDLLASDLQYTGCHQKSLFAATPRLDQIKRLVNEKLGRFSVRSGETLHLPELYTDDAHSYEICDVQGKMCF